jgi:60 kDa SS-A/Ro ribonucleoprotein
VLNIGGFGDSVFELLELYARNRISSEHWAGVIEKLEV